MFLGKLNGSQTPEKIQQTLKALVNHNWQQEVAGHPFFKGWSIGINLHSLQSVILSKSEKTVYLLIAGVMSLLPVPTLLICLYHALQNNIETWPFMPRWVPPESSCLRHY